MLATSVYKHWRRTGRGRKRCFCHDFASQKQIAAAALEALQILRPTAPGSCCFHFCCPPEEFRHRALANKNDGLKYDVVVLGLFGLAEHGIRDGELIECLVALGICDQGPDETATKGDTFAQFSALYENWAALIDTQPKEGAGWRLLP